MLNFDTFKGFLILTEFGKFATLGKFANFASSAGVSKKLNYGLEGYYLPVPKIIKNCLI